MSTGIVVCIKEGADRISAENLANKIRLPIVESPGNELTVLFDETGISLTGFGMTYQNDFTGMIHRVTRGRMHHEMLVKAAKSDKEGLKAIDATAGMGEDAFLLAAYGYQVTLFEQNPIVAALLKDAIIRAKKNPEIKEIAKRMHLIEGNSIEAMSLYADDVDVVYLDPMFPQRQKSGLINKKLQLIQKLEPPCAKEDELFDAAIAAGPKKIIVKRPLKSVCLAGRKPNYTLNGKAIRYDCYVV